MAMKQQAFSIKGMNRDIVKSKHNPEYSFENWNMRLSARDDETGACITNERGTEQIPIYLNKESLDLSQYEYVGGCQVGSNIALFMRGLVQEPKTRQVIDYYSTEFDYKQYSCLGLSLKSVPSFTLTDSQKWYNAFLSSSHYPNWDDWKESTKTELVTKSRIAHREGTPVISCYPNRLTNEEWVSLRLLYDYYTLDGLVYLNLNEEMLNNVVLDTGSVGDTQYTWTVKHGMANLQTTFFADFFTISTSDSSDPRDIIKGNKEVLDKICNEIQTEKGSGTFSYSNIISWITKNIVGPIMAYPLSGGIEKCDYRYNKSDYTTGSSTTQVALNILVALIAETAYKWFNEEQEAIFVEQDGFKPSDFDLEDYLSVSVLMNASTKLSYSRGDYSLSYTTDNLEEVSAAIEAAKASGIDDKFKEITGKSIVNRDTLEADDLTLFFGNTIYEYKTESGEDYYYTEYYQEEVTVEGITAKECYPELAINVYKHFEDTGVEIPYSLDLIVSTLDVYKQVAHYKTEEYYDTSTDGTSYIFRLVYDSLGNVFNCYTVYSGWLHFGDYVECVGVFENDDIQKVYWVDGKNKPRFCNIMKDYTGVSEEQFDFSPVIDLNMKATTEKVSSSSGVLLAGTIQYAFTYYNVNGQETNIITSTPVNYVSNIGNGSEPNKAVGCAFNITLTNVSTDWDYVRIYAIHRTSTNSGLTVRNVTDLKTASTVSFCDDGTTGSTVDSTYLSYVGGTEFIAGTICQKDSTLFLGDIEYKNSLVDDSIKTLAKASTVTFYVDTTKNLSDVVKASVSTKLTYGYTHQLGNNNSIITGYKFGNYYRFGLQLQYSTGKYSEPIWICDKQCDIRPTLSLTAVYPVHAKITISSELKEALNNLSDVINIRPVVVLPTANDRMVLCQGLINPTVWNTKDREENAPFNQASWITRPSIPYSGSADDTDLTQYTKLYTLNHFQFGHNWSLYGMVDQSTTQKKSPYHQAPELQCNYRELAYSTADEMKTSSVLTQGKIKVTGHESDQDMSIYNDMFIVDQSVVTLNSPDIEFDEATQADDFVGTHMEVAGYAVIEKSSFDTYCTVESNMYFKSYGFKSVNSRLDITTGNPIQLPVTGLSSLYIDTLHYKENNEESEYYEYAFPVFMWHSNQFGNYDSTVAYGKYSTKLTATMEFYGTTTFFDSNFQFVNGTYEPKCFNADTVSALMMKTDNRGNMIYYGNIDKVVKAHDGIRKGVEPEDGSEAKTYPENGYPVMSAFSNTGNKVTKDPTFYINDQPSRSDYKLFSENPGFGTGSSTIPKTLRYKKSGISMKYKTAPHLLVATKPYLGKNVIMPEMGNKTFANLKDDLYDQIGVKKDTSITVGAPYETILSTLSGKVIDMDTFRYNLIGEIIRDTKPTNMFGGDPTDNEDILKNNVWIPAGSCVAKSTGEMVASEGDTYVQRYDSMRVKPYSTSDINQVMDIVSVLVESYINLDGRYDRNRGTTDFENLSDENFNLLNSGYTQNDTYFSYSIPDYNLIKSSQKFSSQVLWSQSKTYGELIDTWSHITGASVLDLDGEYGSLTKLQRFNNHLLGFQTKGIAEILYNDTTQISTTEGVPIEIANSGKVQGKRYISTQMGLDNRNAITESPNGLYFIDCNGLSLIRFSDGFANVSESQGFKLWFKENYSSTTTKLLYDASYKDLYIVDDKKTLNYNEPYDTFVSFFNYNNIDNAWNIGNKYFALHDSVMYGMFTGDYNYLFGIYAPYSITYIANDNEPYDKIWNNIDFRGDCFVGDVLVKAECPFDTITSWNEYQQGTDSLKNVINIPSSLKQKYRIWRAFIPRDSSNKLNRMRNPWQYIKLSKETEQTNKIEYHDAIVGYSL